MHDVCNMQGLALIQFAGGLFMFMGFVLFVNRWNPLNGGAGALGMLIAATNSAAIAWGMDGALVPRGWHVFSGMFVLTALHLIFFPNPMLTSAMLLEKEKAKAAKKK